jgi:hypothetical protein
METTMQTLNVAVKESPKVTSDWNKDFLERHNLLGHIYKRTQNQAFYPYWKSQHQRNTMAKEELTQIGQDLAKDNIQVFILKGYSLMGEIYKDWGERFVSDIELLVSHDQLWRLTDILSLYGYKKRREARWLGNRYQHVFTKKRDDVEMSIEIHTQLFWHTQLNIKQAPEAATVAGFYQLSPENQLIHLCGHLAFQHAYSKLFWLMDIFKYVERFKDKIQWSLFWEQAEKANLYKSCYFTLFLCQKLGLNIQTILYKAKKKKKVSVFFLKKLVNYSYLYNPQRFVVRNLAIQFLIKDSIFDNFRYAWAWLKTFRKR